MAVSFLALRTRRTLFPRLVRREELGKFNNHLIGYRTRDLLVCSINVLGINFQYEHGPTGAVNNICSDIHKEKQAKRTVGLLRLAAGRNYRRNKHCFFQLSILATLENQK
jgi:hypothetical protein